MSNPYPAAQFDNFFQLFAQPVGFDLDTKELDRQFRQLQRQYHPDNLCHDQKSTAAAQQQAEQLSSLINHAHQTLKSTDSRAAYLLQMQDQHHDLEHSIADLDFLDDAMSLRIHLDEALAAQHQASLLQLQQQILQRLSSQSDRFANAYLQQDWSTAIDATQKLKFLVKLDSDVAAGVDNLAEKTMSDDDDLYV